MTITVGDIYGKFPNFRPEDMIKLCNGNENLNGRTVVPLANIAAFGDKSLSIFAAELEGKNYTNLLAKNERVEINSAAKVKDTDTPQGNENNLNSGSSISMNTSIFDIAQKKDRNIA